MAQRNDIQTLDDCHDVVERFYSAARVDPLLGPVFASRLARSWPEHMEVMTRFWGAILFAQPLYHGRPLDRHAGLPIDDRHFTRWLALWRAAVDERFDGPRAEHAKAAAARMAARLGPSLAAMTRMG